MGKTIIKFPKHPDFPESFGILCITTRMEREHDRLKALLSSIISLTQIQELFSPKSPENRGWEIRLWHYSKSILDKWEKDWNVGLGEKQATFQ